MNRDAIIVMSLTHSLRHDCKDLLGANWFIESPTWAQQKIISPALYGLAPSSICIAVERNELCPLPICPIQVFSHSRWCYDVPAVRDIIAWIFTDDADAMLEWCAGQAVLNMAKIDRLLVILEFVRATDLLQSIQRKDHICTRPPAMLDLMA